jgi:ABC-type Fe2+-enterobactin transport system substrate-binding protein
MDNQHQGIKGSRDLSQAEVDAMNSIKDMGETLDKLCDGLSARSCLDQRWIEIGRNHLEQGIVALVNAVAQPTDD